MRHPYIENLVRCADALLLSFGNYRKHPEEKVINSLSVVSDGAKQVHFCLNRI